MCRKTELKFSMSNSGYLRIDNNLGKYGVVLLKSEWEALLAGKAFCFIDGSYMIYFREQNLVVMNVPFTPYGYSTERIEASQHQYDRTTFISIMNNVYKKGLITKEGYVLDMKKTIPNIKQALPLKVMEIYNHENFKGQENLGKVAKLYKEKKMDDKALRNLYSQLSERLYRGAKVWNDSNWSDRTIEFGFLFPSGVRGGTIVSINDTGCRVSSHT